MDSLLSAKIIDSNAQYYGLETIQLMESAGKSLAEQTVKDFGSAKKIEIFCGLGNNGGDGLVMARYLSKGNQVTINIIGNPLNFSTAEAQRNFLILQQSNIPIYVYKDSKELPEKINSDIIVDALLGVGVKGKLKEPIKSCVSMLNKSKAKKISVDISTPGFKADKIYCLFNKKISNPDAVLDIGIPLEFNYFTGPGNVKYLNKLKKKSHKGENGKVLVIAGSKQYHGAVIFAAKTASMFSDLVFVLSVKENLPVIKKSSPALITAELNEKNVLKFAKESDSILFGPGVEINSKNKKILNSLLRKFSEKKFILDASAFELVDKKLLTENVLLTPHAKEFENLFKEKPTEQNILKQAKKYGCLILLKSKTDLISNGKFLYFNFSGNPELTKGGTGDVLAGLITAFASQNNLLESSLAGIFLTGFAGDVLKQQKTKFNAEQLMSFFPEAVKLCERF